MKLFSKTLPIIKKRVWYYILGFFVLLIVDGIQLWIPKVIQHVIDGIQAGKISSKGILHSGLLLLAMAGGILMLRYLWRVLIVGNSWFLERELRQDFYNHLTSLSQNFFNKSKTGDLMAHATNDLNAVRMLFGFGFVASSEVFILLFASLFFMIDLNLRLSLLSIIPLPIMTIVVIFAGRKLHKKYADVQASFSGLSGSIQETISGIRVVKAFGQEESELKKMSFFSMNYVRHNLKLALINGAFHPFFNFIVGISMGIVIVWGGIFTIKGEMTPGEFVAFFSYLGMLVWPMIAIGWFINLYQTGTASLKRLNKIFEVMPEINDVDADASITQLQGNIRISNLSFAYTADTVKIFDQISAEIATGKTLAILGRTGCGKTSLIDLLTRIYEPPAGSIFIDEHDIKNIPLHVLRKHVITVPQDIFLFSDSILDNIRLACPNAGEEEVISACITAQVYDDICGFSNGLHTVIGERGVTLSGGQKQRIAIARALLANPEILILDDSLSAVDTKTEKHILDHLIKIRADKTTIIIAHRVSSVEHADNIIVIDNAKIMEQGTHHELINNGGFYKDLSDWQMLEKKIEGE